MPSNGNKKKETSSSSNSTFTIGDIVSSTPSNIIILAMEKVNQANFFVGASHMWEKKKKKTRKELNIDFVIYFLFIY